MRAKNALGMSGFSNVVHGETAEDGKDNFIGLSRVNVLFISSYLFLIQFHPQRQILLSLPNSLAVNDIV